MGGCYSFLFDRWERDTSSDRMRLIHKGDPKRHPHRITLRPGTPGCLPGESKPRRRTQLRADQYSAPCLCYDGQWCYFFYISNDGSFAYSKYDMGWDQVAWYTNGMTCYVGIAAYAWRESPSYTMFVISLDSEGVPWQAWRTSDAWDGWMCIDENAYICQPPGACCWSAYHSVLFGIDMYDSLWVVAGTGGEWGSWGCLSENSYKRVSACCWGYGRIDCIAELTTGYLDHYYYDDGWYGPYSVSEVGLSTSGGRAATPPYSGKFELYNIDTNNELKITMYDSETGFDVEGVYWGYYAYSTPGIDYQWWYNNWYAFMAFRISDGYFRYGVRWTFPPEENWSAMDILYWN